MVLWEVGADFDLDDQVGPAAGPTRPGVAVYVGAATWLAVLGVLRDSPRLTFLATAALVLFTTVQAFAVFAAIVQGAWLFVLMGLVLRRHRLAADRGRRHWLAASLTRERHAEEGPTSAHLHRRPRRLVARVQLALVGVAVAPRSRPGSR